MKLEKPTTEVRQNTPPRLKDLNSLDPRREQILLRDLHYHLSRRELGLMSEIGKFRLIAVADLGVSYPAGEAALRADLSNLKYQRLVSQHCIPAGKGREKFSVLVLTKEAKKLLQQEQVTPSSQALYAGLVKPQEVPHDAAIYRMYQAESANIKGRGGRIRRVVLDYELKKTVFSPLAKARKELSPLEFKQVQAEVAAENGLKVFDGKIPLPDLRIEYETADGEVTKVDLELVTEHYHCQQAAEKLRAGFKTYADQASASRLNAALAYGRSSAYDGPELTAGILSL
jgi:hypothetical protein